MSTKGPYFESIISCGLFGIADDFTEQYLSLDEKFLTHKESTFFVRAGGDSMSPEIKEGDILVVDRALKLYDGAIGAFYFNHQAICKQYFKSVEGIILKSLNTKYKDIVVQASDQLELFGVVKAIVRDL